MKVDLCTSEILLIERALGWEEKYWNDVLTDFVPFQRERRSKFADSNEKCAREEIEKIALLRQKLRKQY
jgi:hypothetical protein